MNGYRIFYYIQNEKTIYAKELLGPLVTEMLADGLSKKKIPYLSFKLQEEQWVVGRSYDYRFMQRLISNGMSIVPSDELNIRSLQEL